MVRAAKLFAARAVGVGVAVAGGARPAEANSRPGRAAIDVVGANAAQMIETGLARQAVRVGAAVAENALLIEAELVGAAIAVERARRALEIRATLIQGAGVVDVADAGDAASRRRIAQQSVPAAIGVGGAGAASRGEARLARGAVGRRAAMRARAGEAHQRARLAIGAGHARPAHARGANQSRGAIGIATALTDAVEPATDESGLAL